MVGPPAEVLGRADLNSVAHGERGSRGVRAYAPLIPHRALGEIHPLRPPPHRRVPLDPQQPTFGVADGHHATLLGGDPAQQRLEQGKQRRERVSFPVLAQVVVDQLYRRLAELRVDTGAPRPTPRLGHDTSHAVRHAPAREVPLMCAAHHADPRGRLSGGF